MKKVEYDENTIIEVLKDINDFVVSLDQVGKVHHEFGESAWREEIVDYLISSKMFDRLANIRGLLSEPFPDDLGDDDMDYLERKMDGIEYWSFKKYLEKKGITDF